MKPGDIEHLLGRRERNHVAFELIVLTNYYFVLPVYSKMRTPNCDIHRDKVNAEALNALLCDHFEKRSSK